MEVFSFARGSRETDMDENFDCVMKELMTWMDIYAERLGDYYMPPILALEAPVGGMSGNVQTALRMAMVAGGIAAIAKSTIIFGRFFLVAPSTWKKTVVGKGNVNKAETIQWLKQNHPATARTLLNDDEADAVCLALYASHMEEKWRADALSGQ